eukprot:TRINITY_DN24048_c0_g2_i5.p1 TRINITY_DN24048_c0_g2~~TRINITY_DN24048_c0_g2_i5.p1  ORF type:complete len:279 (+),score=47.88 TRINITY_DN24048_c0_g2_i5:811-1647(+)
MCERSGPEQLVSSLPERRRVIMLRWDETAVLDLGTERVTINPLKCVVCMDRPRGAAFACGHFVCCTECAPLVDGRCPVCRQGFERFTIGDQAATIRLAREAPEEWAPLTAVPDGEQPAPAAAAREREHDALDVAGRQSEMPPPARAEPAPAASAGAAGVPADALLTTVSRSSAPAQQPFLLQAQCMLAEMQQPLAQWSADAVASYLSRIGVDAGTCEVFRINDVRSEPGEAEQRRAGGSLSTVASRCRGGRCSAGAVQRRGNGAGRRAGHFAPATSCQ